MLIILYHVLWSRFISNKSYFTVKIVNLFFNVWMCSCRIIHIADRKPSHLVVGHKPEPRMTIFSFPNLEHKQFNDLGKIYYDPK